MRNTEFGQKFIASTAAQITEAVDRAAFDMTAWDDFVDLLGGAFPGTSVAFQRVDRRRNGILYDRIINLDPVADASYRQYYSRINPWLQPMRAAQSGTVMVSERDHPASDFQHSEFYNDWLPAEMRASAGLIMDAGPDNLAAIAVHYSVDRAATYDRPVSEVLGRIRKRLSRSMAAAHLFEQTMERARSAAALVVRARDAACVVDRHLRVVDANEHADRQFRHGKLIAMRSGKLSILKRDVNSWLEETVRSLAVDREPERMTSIFLADAPYQLEVTCIPRGMAGSSPFSGGALYLIALRDLSARPESGELAVLAAAFGLTVAERRLCEVLSLGNTLTESASILGVATTTARQHLKAIFQKTGMHRQSELMTLFSRLL